MNSQFLLLYCTTLFLASIIPGPSMLLALNHGMRFGAKRTVATASGNVTASLLQASISLTGLGALLAASETLFLTIKWIGAAYLIIIGIQAYRSTNIIVETERNTSKEPQVKPLHKMFLEAFCVAMGNPKAILFFSALFPQFINMETIKAAELIGAMAMLALIAFLCFMIYAVGGEKVIALFKKSRLGRVINKVVGTAFIGSGIGILIKK